MPLPQKGCQSALSRIRSFAVVSLAILAGLTSAKAQVTANPPEVAFGDVQTGHKSTLPVVLTNNGSSPVTITKGQIEGPGFTVDAKLPIILNPGQNFPLNISFLPNNDGAYSGIISGSDSSGLVVSVPALGSGTKAGYAVGLAWDASPSPPQIVGYNVYRGIQAGGPYGKINSALDPQTAYMDYTVNASETYYYVTTSVDSSGVESTYSNQTMAAIP
jgi:hypothetical protein